MKIRVKTLDRKDQDLEVDDDASLGALRKIIEEQMGIQEARQRLIFQGRPLLCNDRLLKDYGVVDGLTLHMVERPADANIPPGLHGSQHYNHGSTGADEHGERTRVNVINGEMTIIRNSIFQDTSATSALVFEALSTVLGPIMDRTSTDVETQENTPRNGDLTLRVHIRGSPLRHIDSGALSRINQIYDEVQRCEQTLGLLEVYGFQKEPFLSMTIVGYEHVMPPLRSDYERAKFGEIILELEEVLHASHEELSGESDTDPNPEDDGPPSRSPTGPDGSPRQGTILRNATSDEYMELLRRILSLQNHICHHLKRYHDMIGRRSSMSNNRARAIALCYEENIRRVFHRLAHAYHAMSDIAVDFTLAPDAPLEPRATERHDDPITEVVLTLVFLGQQHGQNNRPHSDGAVPEANQQATASDSTNQMQHMGHSRAFRFSYPTRGGLRATVRQPTTVITVPDVVGGSVANAGTRIVATPAVHVQSARIHVTPGGHGNEAHTGISGTSGSNANSAQGQNTSSQQTTISISPSIQTNIGGTAMRGGIQNLLRSILPNAFGNMTPPGQSASGSQSVVNTGRQRNPLLEMHNVYQQGAGGTGTGTGVQVQSNINQPSGTTFRGPYPPGIVGQVIVRTNGAANAEAARRALDAAMQAATVAVGENGVHFQVNGIPRVIPAVGRNRSNIVWARRTYTNRGGATPEHPTDMFIGPHFPTDSTIYTNDPHLNCQSSFCNPRANIRNSPAYETLISDMYQATLRYKSTLDPDTFEALDFETLVERWNRVRGLNEPDAHVALNQRGEALFERTDHFKNVLMNMLRRAIANLADADADVAQRLIASQGEYDPSNYGMVPVVSSPLHGFDIPAPIMGSFELDTMDIHAFDGGQRGQAHDEHRMDNDAHINRTDTTQDSASETQVSSATSAGGEAQNTETDLDVVAMVRTLSDLLQTGRSTTLAQVMREMGQPVTRLNSGFVNLAMLLAYELLQVPELLQIMNGDFSPLSRNRQHIRRFLIENVFNDNCRPSDEDFKNAAERVALGDAELQRFLAFDDVHRYADVEGVGRVNLVASVIQLERNYMEKFLRHLMRTDDDLTPEEFAKTAIDIFTSYVYRAVVLTNLAMNGEPYDYESLLFRLMERPAEAEERHLISYMAQMGMSYIRLLLRRETPFTIHNMLEDVVLATEEDGGEGNKESTEGRSGQDNGEEDDGEEGNGEEDNGEDSGEGNDGSNGEEGNDERVEEEANEGIEDGMIHSPRNLPSSEIDVAAELELSEESGRTDRVDDMELEEAQNAVPDGAHSWITVLPRDWVPVIEDDINRAGTHQTRTFSEAYGMRMGTEGSYDAVVSSAIRRSVEEAVSSSGIALPDIPNVAEANEILQNEFDDLLRQRIARQADFDPEKYPELDKFMKRGGTC